MIAVAKNTAEMASEKAAANSLLPSKSNIGNSFRGMGQAMRTEGLAGTIAAAMQSAEMAKAAMAAKALLALKRDMISFLFP